MTGSLQIKKAIYYAVIRLADDSGKLKQKWISTNIRVTGNNKRKAETRFREILVELDLQKVVYTAEIPLLDWIDKWMEQKKNEVRLNTYESYESVVKNYIYPFFKPLNLTLNKLTPQHIQDFINRLKKPGVFNGKLRKSGLSSNSVHNITVIIRCALQDAFKKNMIAYNPVDRTTLPKKDKFVSKFYTAEQANDLLRAIDDEPIRPAIILGLLFGLRRSEAVGLRWQDVDFKLGAIHIRNTVVRSKTVLEEEHTKSMASKRTLYFVPGTEEFFLKLKQQQAQNRAILKEAYAKSDHVCVWDDGRPISPDYVTQRFAIILLKNNFPHIRFHELRHTAGSLLLEGGASAKQLQEFLGHEQVSTSLNIYAHLSEEGKKETSKTIGKVLKL